MARKRRILVRRKNKINERDWIQTHFTGRHGRLLEIGAYDGHTDSLVVGLLNLGWRGVLVEPNPSCFMRLMAKHENNPNIELVHTAIGPGGLASFWDDRGGQVSSLVPHHVNIFKRVAKTPYLQYTISTTTTEELLIRFGGPKDWACIVIDPEGLGKEIIAALPLAEMTDTEVICVEWMRGPEEIVELLSPYYDIIAVQKPNILARRKLICQ